MNLKLCFLAVLILIRGFCQANMSPPLEAGTMTGSAFSSSDINILSETIQIVIDEDYQTARFIIEYTIESGMDGKQIPLLFYAQDFNDSFSVWLDSNSVLIQNVPDRYMDNTLFKSFAESFGRESDGEEVTIYWQPHSGYVYNINDLKFFETNIEKGTHIVRVEYIAKVWIDRSEWIKAYSFRYSLSPAKYWKSFSTLTVYLRQEGKVRQLSTNLGKPLEDSFQTNNSWKFTKLPGEYMEFTYKPQPGKLAALLIYVQPSGISTGVGVLLFALHFYLVFRYRRKFAAGRHTPALIIGSLLVPLIILFCYVWSYTLIDQVIGEEAGRYHGYAFLIFVLYPVFVIAYWGILWLISRFQKRKMEQNIMNSRKE